MINIRSPGKLIGSGAGPAATRNLREAMDSGQSGPGGILIRMPSRPAQSKSPEPGQSFILISGGRYQSHATVTTPTTPTPPPTTTTTATTTVIYYHIMYPPTLEAVERVGKPLCNQYTNTPTPLLHQ